MATRGLNGLALALALMPATALAQVGAPPMPQAPMPPVADVLPPLPAASMRAMPPMGAPRMMPPMAMPAQPSMPMQPMPVRAMPMQPMPMRGMPPAAMPPRMMPRPGMGGGYAGGGYAGGGYAGGGYIAPSYGFVLPQVWLAPTYYIADYRAYGLGRPAWGYGWSRYYDDYVLTDRYGRVYDWRRGGDARGGDGRGVAYDCAPTRRRDKSGIVGAVIGGVIGAVTGNVIAGAGSRLAGSLIGGGLGALAGQAIDKSTQGRERCEPVAHGGYDDGYRSDGRPHWQGGYPAVAEDAAGCNCTETVTTYVEPGRPIVRRKVTYVTEYVTVPARTKYVRTKYVPRGKYVRLD